MGWLRFPGFASPAREGWSVTSIGDYQYIYNIDKHIYIQYSTFGSPCHSLGSYYFNTFQWNYLVSSLRLSVDQCARYQYHSLHCTMFTSFNNEQFSRSTYLFGSQYCMQRHEEQIMENSYNHTKSNNGLCIVNMIVYRHAQSDSTNSSTYLLIYFAQHTESGVQHIHFDSMQRHEEQTTKDSSYILT